MATLQDGPAWPGKVSRPLVREAPEGLARSIDLRSDAGRRPGWRRAVILAAVIAGGYLALLSWIYCYQEHLIFRPDPLPVAHRFIFNDVHEVSIETLSALHLQLPNPRGVVFYLHGNNGNLATWFSNVEFYREANYDLFMFDYRSYGKSSGRIESEAQLRADVLAAWHSVAPQYAGKRKVIFGRSLGTGLAAGLAAEVQPDLTILVSPYCSMTQLMHSHYPLLPTWLLRYPLATCQDASLLRAPLLLVHGEQDRLIPVTHSEQLLSVAPQARLLRLPAAAHDDVHQRLHFPAYTLTSAFRRAIMKSSVIPRPLPHEGGRFVRRTLTSRCSRGLMQDRPLLISSLIEHAASCFHPHARSSRAPARGRSIVAPMPTSTAAPSNWPTP
jgi:pimeloyl-ACP methyl ester carboxylesterase